MASNFSVTRALATALKTEDALSEDTFAGFVTYAAGDLLTIARIAHVVSSRGVGSSDGSASVTRFARESGRTRSLLSQYATQVEWLIDTATPVVADTFGAAKTLYNRGAASRKAVKSALSGIRALDNEASKVTAWQALLSATPTAPADTTDDTTETPAKRAARPDDGTKSEPFTAGDWLNTLDSLRATVAVLNGAPEETIALARDILADLSARVGATVDA